MGRPDWVNSDKRVSGSKVNLFLSPAIAQRTGVNKSVSFARWQQGAGFVVPRATACFSRKRTGLSPKKYFSVFGYSSEFLFPIKESN